MVGIDKERVATEKDLQIREVFFGRHPGAAVQGVNLKPVVGGET